MITCCFGSQKRSTSSYNSSHRFILSKNKGVGTLLCAHTFAEVAHELRDHSPTTRKSAAVGSDTATVGRTSLPSFIRASVSGQNVKKKSEIEILSAHIISSGQIAKTTDDDGKLGEKKRIQVAGGSVRIGHLPPEAVSWPSITKTAPRSTIPGSR